MKTIFHLGLFIFALLFSLNVNAGSNTTAAFSPGVAISNVFLDNLVDLDNDGYLSSFDINFTINATTGSHNLTAKLTKNNFTVFANVNFTVDQDNPAHLKISYNPDVDEYSDNLDENDLKIEIYDGETLVTYTNGDWNAALDNIKIEEPSQDSPFHIKKCSFLNVEDNDSDKLYAQADIKVSFQVDSDISDSVYLWAEGRQSDGTSIVVFRSDYFKISPSDTTFTYHINKFKNNYTWGGLILRLTSKKYHGQYGSHYDLKKVDQNFESYEDDNLLKIIKINHDNVSDYYYSDDDHDGYLENWIFSMSLVNFPVDRKEDLVFNLIDQSNDSIVTIYLVTDSLITTQSTSFQIQFNVNKKGTYKINFSARNSKLFQFDKKEIKIQDTTIYSNLKLEPLTSIKIKRFEFLEHDSGEYDLKVFFNNTSEDSIYLDLAHNNGNGNFKSLIKSEDFKISPVDSSYTFHANMPDDVNDGLLGLFLRNSAVRHYFNNTYFVENPHNNLPNNWQYDYNELPAFSISLDSITEIGSVNINKNVYCSQKTLKLKLKSNLVTEYVNLDFDFYGSNFPEYLTTVPNIKVTPSGSEYIYNLVVPNDTLYGNGSVSMRARVGVSTFRLDSKTILKDQRFESVNLDTIKAEPLTSIKIKRFEFIENNAGKYDLKVFFNTTGEDSVYLNLASISFWYYTSKLNSENFKISPIDTSYTFHVNISNADNENLYLFLRSKLARSVFKNYYWLEYDDLPDYYTYDYKRIPSFSVSFDSFAETDSIDWNKNGYFSKRTFKIKLKSNIRTEHINLVFYIHDQNTGNSLGSTSSYVEVTPSGSEYIYNLILPNDNLKGRYRIDMKGWDGSSGFPVTKIPYFTIFKDQKLESLNLDTLQISNISITNKQDLDNDGYFSRLKLNLLAQSLPVQGMYRFNINIINNATSQINHTLSKDVQVNTSLTEVPFDLSILGEDKGDFKIQTEIIGKIGQPDSFYYVSNIDSLLKLESIDKDSVAINEFYTNNKIDIDKDGYFRSMTDHLKVISGDTDVSFYGKWMSKISDSAKFTTLFITTPFSTNENELTALIDPSQFSLSHNIYDFKFELYNAENNNLITTIDGEDFSDMSNQKIETPQQDVCTINVHIIYFTGKKDKDKDGYLSSVNFCVASEVNAGVHDITAKAFFRPVGTVDFTPFFTSPVYTVTSKAEVYTCMPLDSSVVTLPHGIYEFKIELYEGDSLVDVSDATNPQKFEKYDEDVITGIENPEISDVKVFPNPVQSELTIILNKSEVEEKIILEVYSDKGNLLNQCEYENTGIIKITFEDYAPGVYIIQLKTKNKVENLRVVKI